MCVVFTNVVCLSGHIVAERREMKEERSVVVYAKRAMGVAIGVAHL